MTKRKIALLGLGAMGSRMASRLIDAGYVLTVYNRTPGTRRGARRAWRDAGAVSAGGRRGLRPRGELRSR